MLMIKPAVGVRQRGFSLIELMIAMTVGLIMVAALMSIFVSNSRAREQLTRSGEQIENGRYAMQTLVDDVTMAGYWAELDVKDTSLTDPVTKPDPCDTSVTNFSSTSSSPLLLAVQGYSAPTSTPLTCISDYAAGTDILVVRRVSTCVSSDASCTAVAGAPYFQASLCNSELSGSPFKISTTTTQLTLQTRQCNGTHNDYQRYLTHIYYIANNDRAGDGIPTLMMAELGAGDAFTSTPIADGIQSLHIEYGIDTNGDGVADVFNTDPDSLTGVTYTGTTYCPSNNIWCNVVALKVYLIARGTSKVSNGYVDHKTYVLGLNANGGDNDVGPFDDSYERHVFASTVRLNNVAGRRQ